MEKDNKNELQSRREFFKNSAKRVLPIIGAMVMANPIIAKAVEFEEGTLAGYCRGGCYEYCVSSCKETCDVTCSFGCGSSCLGNCNETSQLKCTGGCGNGCS